MNPVALQLKKGLAKWKEVAKVDLLKTVAVTVPRISLLSKVRSIPNNSKVVIIASGLHLEETSGPLLLLDPSKMLAILKSALNKGVSFFIYPVINNFGLKYDLSTSEQLLRNNEKGVNYNDGWGLNTNIKCLEVGLVENDIKKILQKNRVLLVLSLHEDSTSMGKGYIWLNSVNAQLRRSIQKKVLMKIDKKVLMNSKKRIIQGAKVEMGFTIVNAKEKGSFEHWLGEDLRIPTLLLEAPFGLDLKTRINFHRYVMAAAISSHLNKPY